MILIVNSWHYHRTGDHLEPLFGRKSPVIPFSLRGGTKVWERTTQQSRWFKNISWFLWFSSKTPSSDEEACKITNFLCIVESPEKQGLIRDKSLRSSTGKDKRDVYKESFSGEIKYLRKSGAKTWYKACQDKTVCGLTDVVWFHKEPTQKRRVAVQTCTTLRPLLEDQHC